MPAVQEMGSLLVKPATYITLPTSTAMMMATTGIAQAGSLWSRVVARAPREVTHPGYKSDYRPLELGAISRWR